MSTRATTRLLRATRVVGGLALAAALMVSGPIPGAAQQTASAPGATTSTPIQHLVVIFQENISFDHYFGTYPVATNPPGEPPFTAAPTTPSVNGLTPTLLASNPNSANPQRLDRSQAVTCDMDHTYQDEQKSFDHGLMDKFVEYTTGAACTDKSQVMDYYDGNTVTALWGYAQHFSMSDNSFDTEFGPSTPGALNLISGQTAGASPAESGSAMHNGVDIGDIDPQLDDCSTKSGTLLTMSGPNVGDLLNLKGVTWGWFEGGFTPSDTAGGVATCATAHANVAGASTPDYVPHHESFEYYQSTANPHHLPPTSVAMIGQTDQASHQYDMTDFWNAVNAGNMPAVSYLKAPAYQDGHASYSDPLDEQTFLVETLNQLQQSPFWSSTAVIISYDDSDGWYDHQMGPIVNGSNDGAFDNLSGDGACGVTPSGGFPDRCGYGPRLPLLVISPYAKQNFVDNTLTDQTSSLRFIEDNWGLGRLGDQSFDDLAGSLGNMFDFSAPSSQPALILDPSTGQPSSS